MNIINEAELRALLTYEDAVAAVENSFAQLARGAVVQPDPVNFQIERLGGEIHLKGAHVLGSEYIVLKVASGFWRNAEQGLPTGSGLMLVPAFIPLCLSASPAREITASGSLTLALAAVGLHMAAMLAVTAVMAQVAVATASRMRPRHRPARHEASAPRDHRPAEQPHRQARAGLLLP